MLTQAEAWSHRVHNLAKIAKLYPQLHCTGLGISIKPEWQYLQRTVPRVRTLMIPIEESIREILFPELLGEEEVNVNFWKILGRSVKHGGLGIPDPQLSAENAYSTSKASCG